MSVTLAASVPPSLASVPSSSSSFHGASVADRNLTNATTSVGSNNFHRETDYHLFSGHDQGEPPPPEELSWAVLFVGLIPVASVVLFVTSTCMMARSGFAEIAREEAKRERRARALAESRERRRRRRAQWRTTSTSSATMSEEEEEEQEQQTDKERDVEAARKGSVKKRRRKRKERSFLVYYFSGNWCSRQDDFSSAVAPHTGGVGPGGRRRRPTRSGSQFGLEEDRELLLRLKSHKRKKKREQEEEPQEEDEDEVDAKPPFSGSWDVDLLGSSAMITVRVDSEVKVLDGLRLSLSPIQESSSEEEDDDKDRKEKGRGEETV